MREAGGATRAVCHSVVCHEAERHWAGVARVNPVTGALFEDLGGGQYLPTAYARGPWSPDALHGGPVALLAARVAEVALNVSGRDAHLPVRLTLN